MSDKLKEAIAPALNAPRSGAARAAWAAAAAAGVLLIIGAGMATSCRGGSAARPWCPDTYTRSFKRCGTASFGRVASVEHV